MAKINQEEYELLRGLDAEWKWIARDSGGLGNEKLFLYLEKPYKDHNTKVWSTDDNAASQVSNQLFQFIQWENEKPYRINELIGEYGSEEEEIKNKAELKAWFEDDKLYMGGYVKHKINQLGESEVLSQEFIDKYSVTRFHGFNPGLRKYIPVEKLQNPLVPKQEEITELDALNRLAENVQFSAGEIASHLEKLSAYNGQVTYGELDEPEVLSQEWISEHSNGPSRSRYVWVSDLKELLVPKQEEIDRAYKDGYEKGKEHATRDDGPETVASVIADFLGAAARLGEVLTMEVEELEE